MLHAIEDILLVQLPQHLLFLESRGVIDGEFGSSKGLG